MKSIKVVNAFFRTFRVHGCGLSREVLKEMIDFFGRAVIWRRLIGGMILYFFIFFYFIYIYIFF